MTRATAASTDLRQTILAAAVAILHSEGAAGLTVRNVASASGCSTTGVYTYFGGKNGLVEAIYLDGFERFDAAVAQARRRQHPGADSLTHLRALAERYRSWALANPTHYLLMFANSVPDYTPTAGAHERSMQSFNGLVELVTAVAADGVIVTEHPARTAFHLWATIHGYVMLELTNRNGVVPGSALSHYRTGLDLILAGIRS